MTDDTFEDQLFRLEDLLVQVAADGSPAATHAAAERAADDGEDFQVANHLNDVPTPGEEALEVCMGLIAGWQFRQRGAGVPTASDVLRRVGHIDRTQVGASADDVLANIPWLLRTALHTLLDDDAVDTNPRGHTAVAARMLAAILGSLEGIDGLHDEAQAPTVGRWSANVVPISTGPRH